MWTRTFTIEQGKTNLKKITGRIKALLLRRQIDYFGDAFGHALAAFRQPLRPPQ